MLHVIIVLSGLLQGIADERAPVPDDAAQKKAEAAIRDGHRKDLAAAKRPAERLALARRFLELAQQTNDDPAACYVLLRQAREAATQWGDPELVVLAVEEQGRRFAIDAAAARREALTAMAEAARSPTATRAVFDACLELLDRAAEDEHYETALDYGRAALAAAHKAHDSALAARVVDRGRQVVVQQRESQAVQAGLKTLAQTPGDPSANLLCGRYLCLSRNQWSQGLPLLAKGSDADLRQRARKDLDQEAKPTAPLEVAESWWTFSAGKEGITRKCLLDRAAYWYRKALPSLDGAEKARVTRRLAEIKGYARPAAQADAGSSPPAGKPSGQGLSGTRGQWVDLAPLIQLDKDTLSGQWRIDGQALKAAPRDGRCRLTIPCLPQGSYDLQVAFTRTAGQGSIGVILPAGTRQCMAVLNCPGGLNGLDTIQGARADHNSSTFPAALNTGRRYTVDVSVRIDGSEATVSVNVDDRTWIFYRGPASALALHEEWKSTGPASLGLVALCDVTFHTLRLRAVSGEIKPLR